MAPCATKKYARRLRSSVSSQPSGVTSSTRCCRITPAELTRMRRPPSARAAWSETARAAAAPRRSACTSSARRPAARIRSTVSPAPAAEPRQCTATSQPARASPTAIACPTRRPAPVTSARRPPSSTLDVARDGQDLARDGLRIVAREKQHGGDELVELHPAYFGILHLRQVVRGLHGPRRHRIDAHALVAELARERARESRHGGLRRDVGRHLALRLQDSHRCEVDDGATAPLQQRRDGGLGDIERGLDVDGELLLELLGRELERRPVVHEAPRDVHDDVEPAELLPRDGHCGPRCGKPILPPRRTTYTVRAMPCPSSFSAA